MTEKTPVPKKIFSADWFTRGVLTKIGDSLDALTGRKWVPSSSLAASELVERIKKLLDAEAKEVPGKGIVVPHNIKLKMQWNKFSDDAEDALGALRTELLTAAADHINDSLYYTYAPISLEIKPDYFIEGVKLYVSFDEFSEEEGEVEHNVTVMVKSDAFSPSESATAEPVTLTETYITRYEINGKKIERRLEFPAGRRRSVGRTSANDLTLDDVSVSKIHASLVVGEDGGLAVADTGSSNGTFINGQRIAYGKAMRLKDGDHVKFGAIDVTFEYIAIPVTKTEQSNDEFKTML